MLLARSSFYTQSRRFVEASRTAREGLALAQRQASLEPQAFFHELLGSIHRGPNRDYVDSLPNYEAAYSVWKQLDDWAATEAVVSEIITLLTEAKQFGAAIERIETFRTDADGHLGRLSTAELLGASATIRLGQGDIDSALTMMVEQVNLLEELRHPAARNLLHIGALYVRKGDFDAALEYRKSQSNRIYPGGFSGAELESCWRQESIAGTETVRKQIS